MTAAKAIFAFLLSAPRSPEERAALAAWRDATWDTTASKFALPEGEAQDYATHDGFALSAWIGWAVSQHAAYHEDRENLLRAYRRD